ncbi:MAG: dephospho-CoA kinase [Desulfobacterales bacterium RIFOXYA12_FULL_46_15]|nr:MAG: dephospho-CoA kinase [Desulfobacula sp. GWF2_41_7]OGR22962.1 MAG: dephospho-CoA kinase [Desulfobacterales bacterium RIFOXYA12_FULL_46_15]
MLKIAVTGSAGSGKSLVCKRFKELGLITLDCDIIARQVVEPGEKGFKDIIHLFGQDVLLNHGGLDRPKLRNLILNNSVMRKKMEELLHPRILEQMMLQISTAAYKDVKAVAVEVPLLFESGMDQFFNVTIAVMAKDQDLVKRISERDRVKEIDAEKMLSLQMPQEEKMARADHILYNIGTNSELFESVDILFHKIQKEFLTR